MAAFKRITFQCYAPQAQKVYVAGDFNHWEPLCGSMRRDAQGVWRATVTLEAHDYEYSFVVDGQWQLDPVNPRRRPNPWGSANSVLDLAGRV